MAPKPEGKVLGKKVAYPKSYSPEILVAIPRAENRSLYGILDAKLPFCGFDTWHAYEISFLTNNGLPVSGLLKIVYNSNSQFLVESKSLKLYFNSFNHEHLGSKKSEAIHSFLSTVKNDLFSLLKTEIELSFFDTGETAEFDFKDYRKLEHEAFAENVTFQHNTETPDLLQFSESGNLEIKVCSDLLRSNCKITNQPDWGSIFIHIKTEKPVEPSSILEYIVSFRNENHFHEEVCEMIYQRFLTFYNPKKLMVACLYTRRGGIDICPVRCSSPNLFPKGLANSSILTKSTLRQ